jgi:hypothetical protein
VDEIRHKKRFGFPKRPLEGVSESYLP